MTLRRKEVSNLEFDLESIFQGHLLIKSNFLYVPFFIAYSSSIPQELFKTL